MSDNYELVREAIRQKKIVVATYRGCKRMMCPHVIGVKNGRRQALFYQFDGESNSGIGADGDPENWRCIPVDQLSDVTVIDGLWHTADNHGRQQSCVGHVDVEVEY